MRYLIGFGAGVELLLLHVHSFGSLGVSKHFLSLSLFAEVGFVSPLIALYHITCI